MPVTPNNFLQSAKDIAASCSGEIAQRNALSRIYYAAFHRTCEVIAPDGKDRTAPGKNSRKPGMHRSYILQLEEAPGGTLERRIAVRMNTLYNSRRNADYKLDSDIPASEFAVNIGLAMELFDNVDRLEASSKPSIFTSEADVNSKDIATLTSAPSAPRRPKLTIIK